MVLLLQVHASDTRGVRQSSHNVREGKGRDNKTETERHGDWAFWGVNSLGRIYLLNLTQVFMLCYSRGGLTGD